MSRVREKDPTGIRAAVFARDKGVCAMCGRNCHRDRVPWEADHILPVALSGGNLGLDNFRTLCRRPCHVGVTRALMRDLGTGRVASMTRYQIAPPETV